MIPVRIGSVAYLNARPLVEGLAAALPNAEIRYEVPSRLADLLAAGELDVALAPCIELARHPEWVVFSDACIGCRGPVLSVKLLFRKPPTQVETLAVDEGSRTSVVLSQILLAEIVGVHPRTINLPMHVDPCSVDADAVLVIGDRAMAKSASAVPPRHAAAGDFPFKERLGEESPLEQRLSKEGLSGEWIEEWDLGDRWCRSTEAPLAFAAWIIRDPDAVRSTDGVGAAPLSAETLYTLEQALQASRDAGVAAFETIAARESVAMRLPYALILSYFRENLNYYFGPGERHGLRRYFQLAAQLGLIPAPPRIRFYASPVRH